MFKLTKYEFRKNITSIIIVLLILFASQGYFTISFLTRNELHAAIASVILVIVGSISFIVVIAFGISAYEKELKSKSSYLIFMTPNSSLKIILSKIFYTFLFGVLLFALLFAFSYLDVRMLSSLSETPVDYVELLKLLLSSFGLDYMSIFYGIVAGIVTTIISILFVITLAYFSITLASTWLQNKKVKGFISVVIFFAIMIATEWISHKLPTIYADPRTTFQAIASVLPSVIFELVISLGCIFGSAVLLDKKVSL